MFSGDALDSFMDKAQRSDHRNRGVKTYATKTDITEEKKKCQSPCHMCKKIHDMDNCKKFLELGVNERSRYLAKNKLCFGCYDPITSKHSAKTCTKRITFKECKNYHLTALHGYQYKKENNAQWEKMMMGKRKKLRCQIDAQKYKISAMLSLTKKLVWSVCVLFQ